MILPSPSPPLLAALLRMGRELCIGWMAIPYLVTVSCAMLASNNSSVLQGIVHDRGAQASSPQPVRGFWTEIKSRLRQNTVSRHILQELDGYQLIEHTYEGRFQTVTVWNRAHNKRRWVVSSPPRVLFPSSNIKPHELASWTAYPPFPFSIAIQTRRLSKLLHTACPGPFVSRPAILTPRALARGDPGIQPNAQPTRWPSRGPRVAGARRAPGRVAHEFRRPVERVLEHRLPAASAVAACVPDVV